MIKLFVILLKCVLVISTSEYEIFPPLPMQIIQTTNNVCRDHSRLYVENLKNFTLWAYEMHDSTANSVTGILRGSISQFGQFEQCLTSKAPFQKQYCITAVTADVPKPNPPRDPLSLDYSPYESVLRKVHDHKDPSQQRKNFVLLGWCVPASCSPSELETHLNQYYTSVDFPMKQKNVSYKANIGDINCQNEVEKSHYTAADVSFCMISGIIFVLVISSTIYGCLKCPKSNGKSSEESALSQLFTSFCLPRNFNKLFSYHEANPALNILYGMRVFCICMIITDHRFGTHLASGVLNFNIVEEQYRATFGTIFFHGDLFVDSFFILSGLLVTYSLLSQYERKVLHPFFIVLMRYIRLTPVYAFVVFYSATLFYYSANGPMWKTIMGPEVADCRNNWWTNLLYISNYVNADHMCMVHSWYLPCDFHYFIVAIVICTLISKNKRMGLILLGIVTFMTVLIPFVLVYVYERPAVLYFYPDFIRAPKADPDFLLTYSKSHTRSSPYFIGMIAGYIYYKMKNTTKTRMSKMASTFFIIFSLIVMVSSIFTGTIFYNPYHKYNALESALYASLHRTVWSVGSVGVLYTASFGHSGFIRKFLTWSPWVPISKLVYGAYLTHMQFQMRSLGKKGGADVVSYFDIISLALSDIVLAFSTALILYLSIEAPVRNIFNVLISQPRKRNSKSKSNEGVSQVTCDSHL